MTAFFKLDEALEETPTLRHEAVSGKAFGTVMTDHMVTIRYQEGKGWFDGRLTRYQDLKVSPVCSAFQYAQEIFEGMKAFYQADESIALFRPMENAKRFQRSAKRLAMPELPTELFMDAVETLISADKKFVPKEEGGALYLRPFMIGVEGALGLKPASEYLFCVVASPVQSYFKSNQTGIKALVSEQFTRAASGGTGAAKCGGNYAASLIAQIEANESGFDQPLFLDANERLYIEELASMNVFMVYRNKTLITPSLNGNILAGITRDSIILLAKNMGYTVREKRCSIEELLRDIQSGELTEMFACGTAASISSIAELGYQGARFMVGDGIQGEVTNSLKQVLLNIQYGHSTDAFDWQHTVDLNRVETLKGAVQ